MKRGARHVVDTASPPPGVGPSPGGPPPPGGTAAHSSCQSQALNSAAGVRAMAGVVVSESTEADAHSSRIEILRHMPRANPSRSESTKYASVLSFRSARSEYCCFLGAGAFFVIGCVSRSLSLSLSGDPFIAESVGGGFCFFGIFSPRSSLFFLFWVLCFPGRWFVAEARLTCRVLALPVSAHRSPPDSGPSGNELAGR